MSYGLSILNDAGKLWLSPDFTPLNFQRKIAFSGNGTINTGVPSSSKLMFFIKNNAEYQAGTFKQVVSNGIWQIKITGNNGSGYFYIFSNQAFIKRTHGIAIYNSVGELTWSTDMIPLMINRIKNQNGITNSNFYVNVGFPVAVSAGLVSSYKMMIDPAQHLFIFGWMGCGAFGNNIYVSKMYTEMLQSPPDETKVKDEFFYINTSFYD